MIYFIYLSNKKKLIKFEDIISTVFHIYIFLKNTVIPNLHTTEH